MNLIYQSPFLKALGWCLVNSFWQMGMLWLAYVCLTANSKKFSPAIRHTLALLTICGGCAWFIGDLIINVYGILNGKGWPGYGSFFLKELAGIEQLTYILQAASPFLSVVYLIAVSFLLAGFIREYRFHDRLYHTHIQLPHDSLILFLEQAAAEIGINRKVNIWLSQLVDTPLTIGFWKPLILLPVTLLNQLTPSQAEAIIIHELHHIKRNDYLVNLVMTFAEIFLFFNPFSRILAGIVKKERENSCDDKVLQLQYDVHQYAQALLMLEKNRHKENGFTMAATGRGHRGLLNRVKRMAYGKADPSPIGKKLAACFLALLLAISTGWRQQVPVKVISNSESFPLAYHEIPLLSSPAPPFDWNVNSYNTSAPEVELRAYNAPVEKILLEKQSRSGETFTIEKPGDNYKFNDQEQQEGLQTIVKENQQDNTVFSYASVPAASLSPVTSTAIEQLSYKPGSTYYPEWNLSEASQDFQLFSIAPNLLIVIKETGEGYLLKLKAPEQAVNIPAIYQPAKRQPTTQDTLARIRKIIHI